MFLAFYVVLSKSVCNRLMKKTATHRQSDLVRLLLNLPRPVVSANAEKSKLLD